MSVDQEEQLDKQREKYRKLKALAASTTYAGEREACERSMRHLESLGITDEAPKGRRKSSDRKRRPKTEPRMEDYSDIDAFWRDLMDFHGINLGARL